MAQRAVLFLFCALGLFQKGVSSPVCVVSPAGLAALIETQQTVLAAVGEEAQLNCKLMQHRDVLQVTWQKLLPDEEQNLASNNKYFGQKVNSDLRDKMEFKYVGLLSCSIVIRNVTEEDEGCYHCLFNTYPEGALTATTCLRLYELHGPVLHVRASDSPEETVVSCWATGGPAPTVTLTVPHYNSSRVTNSNGTVTVTTTALLSALHHNTTQVNCTAHVSSGPHREVATIIPAGKQSSVAGRTRIITFLLFSIFVACCFAAAAKCFLHKQRNHNSLSHSRPEMNEKPQTTISDIYQ
ncbi:OX-2 membrane glycoprotein-like [Centropristis striata]|uniref:OX-2 membrane glycoprotein-like n=1 Tax=Centropristis striata TaxID=184440 RepID=UPI0027E12971|nr:OX-2 membrane glycoprotein-like [Centropristis striata]